MKKRMYTVMAAMFLAFAITAPVSAAAIPSPEVKAGDVDSNGNVNSKFITDKTNDVINAAEGAVSPNKLKLSGASNSKVSIVANTAKDNIHDNGIKPAVKEFVTNSAKLQVGKGSTSKAKVSDIAGIYYFDLTADQTGDVTFKLEDKVSETFGDGYAIILHYTGNAADEDGITAQYSKISEGGKVTVHFNSYSPVAIIPTKCTSAQILVNTYSHSQGSDSPNAAPSGTTTTTTTTPAAQNAQNATRQAATDANGAAAAQNTEGAEGDKSVSPKTGDSAATAYLLLTAMAASGMLLVATKKNDGN